MSLGNFSISRELGQGGMATVFLAEDKKFDTFIAIKLLKKEFVANENIRKRFVAEAKNMYRMSHPNIIKVTDLIDEGDTVAFIMEYIEGETLKEFLDRKGRLSDGEIKSIFTQMLEAVSYVHEQNLVHRDIKPSNFMVDKKGKVKLMDFGIAKNTDQNSSEYTLTGTGMQMGTPMYMSPEQIKSTKEVTATSDIYSLGVVLWQLVMGKRPYEGDTLSTFEIQLKIVQQTLDLTDSMWDAYIQRATAKNAQDRYASCSAWLSELTKGIQEAPSGSKNDSTVIERFDAADKTLIEKEVFKENMLQVSILAPFGMLKYGFVDVQGNWLIQPMFDELGDFDERGFCKATVGVLENPEGVSDYLESWLSKKTGFINRKGEWVIQPLFESLDDFDQRGWCKAGLHGKVGYIDRSGNWLIQPVFDRLNRFDEKGYCCATVNDKVGIINKAGNWVIQPMFDHVGYSDDQGYSEVELNGKFGFIDESGHWITQAKFDMLGRFDDYGFAIATYKGKDGVIDRSGKWVIQPQFEEILIFGNQNVAPASFNEKWGFIDKKGLWVIEPIFDRLYTNFDPQGFAPASLNDKWGFIDKKGNWIIQPMFDYLGHFDAEGYALAKVSEKEGYIDRRGNWIIQPIFDELHSFDDSGVALVTKGEKSGLIDRKGDSILQISFKINYFNQFGEQGFIIGDYSKYGIIDKKGNWIVSPTFLVEEVIRNQVYKVSENNKFGFIDASGNWIIPPKFDYVYSWEWDDSTFIWNEETKDWEFENSSESTFSDIADETIEGYFSHLVGKEKVFLSNNLPANKLKNFINQFNTDFFTEGTVVVYYDDTLWGKGDNGFVIFRSEFNRLYLFVSVFAGEKLAFCFENDNANPTLFSSSYLEKDKKLQLTHKDKEGNEKILGWHISSNLVALALDKFIQENTGEQNIFDFSKSL